jgi:hypothetical protein
MAERPTCGTCPYFDRWNATEGECRRHAPNFVSRNDLETDDWGAVDLVDWCGDHPDFDDYIRELRLEKRDAKQEEKP